MVRKTLAILIGLLLITGVAYGAGMKSLAAYFSTAASEIAQIVQATKDTSQTVSLVLYPKGTPGAALFPSAIMLATVYTSRNDSINVKVHMDLSDDGSNWFAYLGAAEDSSLTSGTANDYNIVHLATTTMPRANYARFRLVGAMAAADTVDTTLRIRLYYSDNEKN